MGVLLVCPLLHEGLPRQRLHTQLSWPRAHAYTPAAHAPQPGHTVGRRWWGAASGVGWGRRLTQTQASTPTCLATRWLEWVPPPGATGESC